MKEKYIDLLLTIFVWGAHIADMQEIRKFIKGFRFLFCAIDIYSKYSWVVPLRDKKVITVTNAFQNILDEWNRREATSKGRKSNKIWVDKGSEFYYRTMKSSLEKHDMEMYATHNEGKSVIAKRFIRILKNKICKYMSSVSKNA